MISLALIAVFAFPFLLSVPQTALADSNACECRFRAEAPPQNPPNNPPSNPPGGGGGGGGGGAPSAGGGAPSPGGGGPIGGVTPPTVLGVSAEQPPQGAVSPIPGVPSAGLGVSPLGAIVTLAVISTLLILAVFALISALPDRTTTR